MKKRVFWPFSVDFKSIRNQIGGKGSQGSCESILESAWVHAEDICPPQVYAISIKARSLDFCPPQVYAISV